MGYTFKFGNFYADIYPEERRVSVTVTTNGLPDPINPPYDSSGYMTRGSHCAPSYSAWTDFTRQHGLHDVFFLEGPTPWWTDNEGNSFEPLLIRHPGAQPLDQAHLDRFLRAQQAHKVSYDQAAEAIEAWDARRQARREQGAKVDHDDQLATPYWDAIRLNWLVYWTQYALNYAEFPTFANS